MVAYQHGVFQISPRTQQPTQSCPWETTQYIQSPDTHLTSQLKINNSIFQIKKNNYASQAIHSDDLF